MSSVHKYQQFKNITYNGPQVSCNFQRPTELLALQVYCPPSALFILLKVSNTVLFPEFFTFPFLIHCTSGSGIPDAAHLILTADPSM